MMSQLYCFAVIILSVRCAVRDTELDVLRPLADSQKLTSIEEQKDQTIFKRDLSQEGGGCQYFADHGLLSEVWTLPDYFAYSCWLSCVCYTPQFPGGQDYRSMNAGYAEAKQSEAELWTKSVDKTGRAASWVDSFSVRNAFIASYAPLSLDGASSFWNIVWRNNVRVIVMLTKPMENRELKSFTYWPTKLTKPILWIKSYKITKLEEYSHNGFVCSTLRLFQKNLIERREVFHCLFKEWPDMSIPRRTDNFLAFMRYVKDLAATPVHQKIVAITGQSSTITAATTQSAAPILVHCHAGLGRTGTYIAIDVLIERMETVVGGPVDLAGVVRRLRAQRPGAILTEAQYNYCVKALKAYVPAQPCTR